MSKRGVCNIILNGNRTNTGFSTGTGNELSTDGTWNFTFDNEGNITKGVHISDGITWTFNYDNLNHLTGAQQRQTDGGTLLIQTTYLYDVHANLIERDVWTQVGGTTITARYALDGNQVWADLDGSNTLQTRYLRGDAVDNLFARTSAAGAVGWYLADHLGSVRDIMGNTGTVLDHIDYDPFGNIINETNASSGDRYKYALLQWDTQLGLYWAGRRFFYAADGRWMSQDPLGFAAGDANLYRYVGNLPTTAIDPSGLDQSYGPFSGPTKREFPPNTVLDQKRKIVREINDILEKRPNWSAEKLANLQGDPDAARFRELLKELNELGGLSFWERLAIIGENYLPFMVPDRPIGPLGIAPKTFPTIGMRGRVLSAAEQAEFNAFAQRAQAVGLEASPYRTGSWGRTVNGRFQEVTRIDVAEAGMPGFRGQTHMHIAGQDGHLPLTTPLPGE